MRLLSILLFASVVHAGEVMRVGMWELHSSFWMNLHQTLMHDASTSTPRDFSALTPEERTAWTAAVTAYRTMAEGKGNITFVREMQITQDELSQVADGALNAGIDGPLADAVKQAAPVYRKHWWTDDDRANRFFMGYAAAMLRDAGDELARQHEAVYREKFPETIRVDISAYGGRFGAYTIWLRNAKDITTMSSRNPGYQGHAALEMILHESSHTIVNPRNRSLATAIAASSKRLGIEPPPDLWHAILFGTTSELAVRALKKRGVTNYVPSSQDLFTRAWPQYRAAIETHWYPYLDGKGTLEEAVDKVVTAVK